MVAEKDILHEEHEIALTGAWPSRQGQAGPTLLQRKEEDFLGALLNDLKGDSFTQLGSAFRPPTPKGELRLYQPVHRVFNIALLEAHCLRFMHPRLDSAKVESAGIVVRRLSTDDQGHALEEAWMVSKGRGLGWVALQSDDLVKRDPDPARRTTEMLTGNATFDAAHRQAPDASEEQVTRLFLAPPEVFAKTGQTVLYAVIPVTSTSRSGRPRPPAEQQEDPNWAQHLQQLLRASSNPLTLEFGPGLLTPDDASTYDRRPFMSALTQLRQEFQLFSGNAPAEAAGVLTVLNRLQLTLQDGSTHAAGDYLAQASAVCLDRRQDIRLQRPLRWPAVPASVAADLEQALRLCGRGVLRDLVAPDGSSGRYDEPGARYVLRAFVRVKRPCACPPRLIWSDPSEPFTIAPWHEPGPAAPVQISLPDPFDRGFLGNTRPGVAFSVPASLSRFLNQDAKEMLKGNGNSGSGFTLDWICGFSIPILTLCAFIVLSIFLALFNLIFFWLPLVKICIPFPRKK
jgi:hypothetical protein